MSLVAGYASISAMAERLQELGDFKGVGHFDAKFQAEGLRFVPMSMDRLVGE